MAPSVHDAISSSCVIARVSDGLIPSSSRRTLVNSVNAACSASALIDPSASSRSRWAAAPPAARARRTTAGDSARRPVQAALAWRRTVWRQGAAWREGSCRGRRCWGLRRGRRSGDRRRRSGDRRWRSGDRRSAEWGATAAEWRPPVGVIKGGRVGACGGCGRRHNSDWWRRRCLCRCRCGHGCRRGRRGRLAMPGALRWIALERLCRRRRRRGGGSAAKGRAFRAEHNPQPPLGEVFPCPRRYGRAPSSPGRARRG